MNVDVSRLHTRLGRFVLSMTGQYRLGDIAKLSHSGELACERTGNGIDQGDQIGHRDVASEENDLSATAKRGDVHSINCARHGHAALSRSHHQ